jgi:hypothetical protein
MNSALFHQSLPKVEVSQYEQFLRTDIRTATEECNGEKGSRVVLPNGQIPCHVVMVKLWVGV